MNKIELGGYTRISKADAIKRFANGQTIRIVPCKYRPDNMWITYDADPEYLAEKYSGSGDTFDKMFADIYNDFERYNCNYEVGYYPAYYIKG